MRKLACLITCLLLSAGIWAQQRITGHVVKSSTKEPLAGVSVSTKQGAVVTDSTGRFSIVASPGENLTISYVGMQSTTIKVTGSQDIAVELSDGQASLEQVVVVGY